MSVAADVFIISSGVGPRPKSPPQTWRRPHRPPSSTLLTCQASSSIPSYFSILLSHTKKSSGATFSLSLFFARKKQKAGRNRHGAA